MCRSHDLNKMVLIGRNNNIENIKKRVENNQHFKDKKILFLVEYTDLFTGLINTEIYENIRDANARAESTDMAYGGGTASIFAVPLTK